MAIKLVSVPVVAIFLPIFWLGILPNQVFAQLPCIDALAGANDKVIPAGFTLQERPELTTSVFGETTSSNAFVRFFRDGEWYFSWGYSRESWAPANISVSQPSQGNNFTIYGVRATDDPSWGSLFSAQYNIRIGRFVDEERTLAVELNFDHTKYTSVVGQTAHIAGTIAGRPTDANFQLDDQFFSYKLHNGANHLMVNLFKRVPLIGETNESFSIAAIAKVGVGVMVPHSENVIMGNANDVGKKEFNNLIGFNRGWWQLNGVTTGVECGFRMVLVKPLYIELTDKIAYARLGNIPVYQGTARQNLWMNEIILSMGITYGGGR